MQVQIVIVTIKIRSDIIMTCTIVAKTERRADTRIVWIDSHSSGKPESWKMISILNKTCS